MTISFARHQFPPAIIRRAVWLYVRFTLSYRDVEDLLAERGLDVSYETVRRWVLKFGPLFARELRRRRPRPTARRFRRSILQVGRFTPACSAVSRCCCRSDPGSSGRRANASGSCARGPEGPVHSSQNETAPKVGPL